MTDRMDDCCSICCEAFNRSSRRPVACPYCPTTTDVRPSCTACVQRYLLTVDDPECMRCRRSWTPDFVDASPLPRTFVAGELKRHRERVLLERERALMPATQASIRRDQEVEAAAAVVRERRAELANAILVLHAIQRGGLDLATANDRRAFVKPCPGDGCRGFLTTAYRCGLCDARVCPQCHEPCSDPHACDPAAVETIQAIKRDCKPCPKCGAMIQRIEGCNQMFCTAPGCHTAFDWATLRFIDARLAHNPHLFEYRRQLALAEGSASTGAEGARAECRVGVPSLREMTHSLNAHRAQFADDGDNTRKRVMMILRFLYHLEGVELAQNYRAAPDVIDPTTNEDIRKRFLRNEIDEARLSALLQVREKARRKRDTIHQILRTFVDVASDVLRTVLREASKFGDVRSACRRAIEQTDDVARYANEALAAAAKRYAGVTPRIERCSEGAWTVVKGRS